MTNAKLNTQSTPSKAAQPPAPIPLAGIRITDAILKETASQGGVPFQVQLPATPPPDTNFYFNAHVIAGPLQLKTDISLQFQTLAPNSAGGPTTLYVPANSDIFKVNQIVVIYYWTQTSNEYPAVSEALTIIVDRDSLKNQAPDPDLIAPIPLTYDFNSLYSGEPFTLKVNLGRKINPQINDGIRVQLNITETSWDDLNKIFPLASLPEYFLTKEDIEEAAPNVIIRFDGADGDPQGFPADLFLELKKLTAYGELYFLYRPAGKNASNGSPAAVLRSPSAWIKIEQW